MSHRVSGEDSNRLRCPLPHLSRAKIYIYYIRPPTVPGTPSHPRKPPTPPTPTQDKSRPPAVRPSPRSTARDRDTSQGSSQNQSPRGGKENRISDDLNRGRMRGTRGAAPPNAALFIALINSTGAARAPCPPRHVGKNSWDLLKMNVEEHTIMYA